ncbi:hypothetical protein, partial [Lentilactobacillus hilgardii]|uniref:hypothetical protein n=1 Tax=Lentilactobacillus hilgardii TaxID=1588 RepID=UPI0021C405F7
LIIVILLVHRESLLFFGLDALRIPEMISLCYIKIQKIQVTREYDLVLLGFFILLGLLSQPLFDLDKSF